MIIAPRYENESYVNGMKDFSLDKKNSSYLHMFHMCFRWMTFMYKQNEYMEK